MIEIYGKKYSVGNFELVVDYDKYSIYGFVGKIV